MLLGLNQTLVLAFLPELSLQLGFNHSNKDLGIVAVVLNLNLISYWFGVKFWGDKLNKRGLWRSTVLAVSGFLVANLVFCLSIFVSDQPSVLLVSASRLLLGLFSSAFIILAHSHLAIVNKSNLGQLAKTNGSITIGRLLGPSLALLPLVGQWVLISPVLMALLVLVYCLVNKASWPTDSELATPIHSPYSSAETLAFKHILLLAVLTTSLVSMVQYHILPLLISFGYQGAQATKIYASLLLYLSAIIIVYQFVLLPLFARSQARLPAALIGSLIVGALLLSVPLSNWSFVLLALAVMAFAISGLPSWYSQQAYANNPSISFRAKRSAFLARAHTAGYLIGTAVASASLMLGIPLLTPIWVFSLAMVALVLVVNQHARLQPAPN
ncbi:MFS transporter [Agarivorans sp. DSG3-1]|uniref:MFS transporter n=1 Tax=Agarivorans sp. DSG3-1 TaxID=3342249 RepID=UPI00398E8E15